jgi:hypothetical protein
MYLCESFESIHQTVTHDTPSTYREIIVGLRIDTRLVIRTRTPCENPNPLSLSNNTWHFLFDQAIPASSHERRAGRKD